MASNSDYTTVIKPHAGLFNLKLREVWAYRDLVFILARRDIVAVYKQTILGPLWFLVSPVLTVVVYMFVFGSIAGISTDGMPQAVFYLGGITLWNYFSSCFTATANTFTANAQIFGKVYFPRIVAPMANVLSNHKADLSQMQIPEEMINSLINGQQEFEPKDQDNSRYEGETNPDLPRLAQAAAGHGAATITKDEMQEDHIDPC